MRLGRMEVEGEVGGSNFVYVSGYGAQHERLYILQHPCFKAQLHNEVTTAVW